MFMFWDASHAFLADQCAKILARDPTPCEIGTSTRSVQQIAGRA